MASSSPVEDIFLAALEKASPQERSAFLDEVCQGDLTLRRRVDRLLEAHPKAEHFLERPPAALQATERGRPPERDDDGRQGRKNDMVGMVIAERYKLLEEIAEGGMGTVWVAEQAEPVRRPVALKLIKPGMDSRQVLSRFEAERHALALMDHPNIARVLDGGATDQGRPFFVMEYVKGVPITDFCDQARLTVQDRLKLFVQVCQAVQHAHQKGIIHRDLKPSNILVCLYDGQPVPKVIDFGLAKAMHQPLTEHTCYSAHGLMVGTPLYMSPEQAEFNNLDIDTRTDVYSLGVILYELLTGTTPLDRQRFEDAGWQEILRLIKEEEPTKPSTKLSGSGSFPSIAAQRSLEPAQLRRAVRGDLDWIVMKALEKERSRRYESANDLAHDLERYLRDDPIVARPPSTVYRLRKLARRHRLALLATALVSATLIVGTIVSTALAIRAVRAMRLAEAARADEALHRKSAEQARAAEAAQRKIAEDERNEAERRRAQAEINFQHARTVIDGHFTSLRENKLLNVPALQPLRRELLASALVNYREFIDQYRDDPTLAAEVATAYLRIGELTRAMGSNEQAIEAFQQATQRYERLFHDRPEAREYWSDAANAYNQLGQLQQAAGRLTGAEGSYTRALDIRQKLAQEARNDRNCRANVASAYVKLGNVQTSGEQFVEAEESFRRALEIHERLAGEEPSESTYRADLAEAYFYLERLQRMTGRLVEAEASSQRALQIYEQLVHADRANARNLAGVAGASYQLGHVKRIAGQFDAAEASYARALELYERLGRQDPLVGLHRRAIGGAHFHLGLLQAIAGRKDEAIRSWTTAIADFRAATELGLESVGFLSSQADALAMLGRWREAADVLAKSLDTGDYHWRPRCQLALLRWAGGDEVRYRAACSDLVARRGSQATAAEAGAIATVCLVDPKAVDDWNDVLGIARRAAAADPTNAVYLTLVGAAQYRAGQMQESLRTLEQALPLHPSADSSASPLLDPVRASRVLGETMLMLVYRERHDERALAQQLLNVQDLVSKMKSTPLVYCDEGENWRIAFAVLFAQRELARLPAPTAH